VYASAIALRKNKPPICWILRVGLPLC